MTSISVHTGALSGAAARLQALGGDTQQRARGVDSVQRDLALQIEARQQFDQRLRALSAKLNSQADALAGHSRFLAMAAARYEAAETTTQQRAPHDAPQAGASQGLAGVFGKAAAEYAKLVQDTELLSVPMSPLVILSMLGAAGEDRLDGWAEAHNYKLVVGAADFVGEIPGVGTVLTLGEVELQLRDGNVGGAVWAGRGFIPGEGLVEGGLEVGQQIGDFVAVQGGVIAWATDHVQGADGWAPNYSTLVSNDIVSDAGNLVTSTVNKAWDWVTCL